MTTPIARIVELAGREALCRVDSAPACPRCAAGRGCGAGLLQGTTGPRDFRVAVPPGMNLAVGDTVSLSLPPERLLRASLLAYGLPLGALAAAPLLASWLWGPLHDLVLAGIAMAGVVVAVAAGRRRLSRDACLSQLQPSIDARVPGSTG